MHKDDGTEWIKEKVRAAADSDEESIETDSESGDTIDDPSTGALDASAAAGVAGSLVDGAGGLAAGSLSQGATTGQRFSTAAGDVYMSTER